MPLQHQYWNSTARRPCGERVEANNLFSASVVQLSSFSVSFSFQPKKFSNAKSYFPITSRSLLYSSKPLAKRILRVMMGNGFFRCFCWLCCPEPAENKKIGTTQLQTSLLKGLCLFCCPLQCNLFCCTRLVYFLSICVVVVVVVADFSFTLSSNHTRANRNLSFVSFAAMMIRTTHALRSG